MNRWILTAIFALVAIEPSALAAEPGQAEFKLKIKAEKGPVYCRMFAAAKGYPMKAEHAQKTITAKVEGTTAVCLFGDMAPGTYALMAFHDLNSNGKLDTNWMGIPREGVVSSNNAKGRMGPPSFKDASFKVASGAKFTQALALKYY